MNIYGLVEAMNTEELKGLVWAAADTLGHAKAAGIVMDAAVERLEKEKLGKFCEMVKVQVEGVERWNASDVETRVKEEIERGERGIE